MIVGHRVVRGRGGGRGSLVIVWLEGAGRGEGRANLSLGLPESAWVCLGLLGSAWVCLGLLGSALYLPGSALQSKDQANSLYHARRSIQYHFDLVAILCHPVPASK